ncbi:S8 family serine peptidase [Lysobacter sp. F60174L2]|uniref:S8 family serine peptidase n=1 Tax=Lysobacter sp. F60174L2 TaxID=3459295 RepID=UPI00403DE4AF
MTSSNNPIRMSLMATMIASALAAPAAMAANGQLQVRPMAAPTTVADHGARLIVRYHDERAPRTNKLQTVNGAANRAHAARAIRSAADARQPAPTASHMRQLAVGADLFRLSHDVGAAELAALVRELKADPAVKSVDLDRMVQAVDRPQARMPVASGDLAQPQLTVDDEYFNSHQWHLQASAGGIDAPAAWDVSTGEGVVVAVLDTGIVAHPDMDANMLDGYDFITDAAVSRRPTDDRAAGAHDYGDWYDAGECGKPVGATSSFHGTHVAGTVAELSNNGSGMAGVAHNARVLPVRVLGKCGGYPSDIADAIVWAAGGDVPGVPANEFPAEVINMSLGGGQSCPSITQDAINTAVALGTTVVVAAGNSNDDAANYSPASCDNVVTVGAVGITGARANYSNYGAAVDLAGPGGGVVEGNPDGYVWQAGNDSATSPELGTPTYMGMAGTSMAAPHVAGVVALVQSAVVASGAAPKTPAEIEAILVDSARPFPGTPDKPIGSGLLDAPAALAQLLPPCDPEVEDCGPDPIALLDSVPVRDLAGNAGNEVLYSIEVPAGSTMLSVMTYGGSGNVSVYASAGEEPTTEAYDLKSSRPGNSETIRVRNPAAGTYYILVVGENAYRGVTIQARVN